MFKNQKNSNTKKDSKTKKNSKLLVPKNKSKTISTRIILPEAPTPPCVVLKPLPWSEWTWDTHQHFYFRARRESAGWEYEYSIPHDYEKRREQAMMYMASPHISQQPYSSPSETLEYEVEEADEMAENEAASSVSASESGGSKRSSISSSGSGSVSGSSTKSSSTSELSHETFDSMVFVEQTKCSKRLKNSRRSPVVVSTRKHASGEVVIEVMDAGCMVVRHGSSSKGSSDWGYTSEDEW